MPLTLTEYGPPVSVTVAPDSAMLIQVTVAFTLPVGGLGSATLAVVVPVETACVIVAVSEPFVAVIV